MARIAVVDDDEDILHVMQDTLSAQGWDTSIPIREDAPFADLQAQHPDAIVMDLWLDIPDARWKLLHHLKRKQSTRDMPVIICTGVPERLAGHEHWLRQNSVTVLRTPCDVRDLDQAIAAQLRCNAAQ